MKKVILHFNLADTIAHIEDKHLTIVSELIKKSDQHVALEEKRKIQRAQSVVTAAIGRLFLRHGERTIEVYGGSNTDMVADVMREDGTASLFVGIVYDPKRGSYSFNS